MPSVRFSVESRGRKRKGVSENHDPCRGRREETPDDYIPNPEGNTAGVAGTSLAADRRAGSGDAEASGGRAAGGRTGSAGSPRPPTRGGGLSPGVHGAGRVGRGVGEAWTGGRSPGGGGGRERAGGGGGSGRVGRGAVW